MSDFNTGFVDPDGAFAWPQLDANGALKVTGVSGTAGAPASAKYITQEAEAGLSAEQSLGALTTGLLLNTVTGGVGVLSTAVADAQVFPRVYNVKAYGAVGNGSTDDTAAIQAAIDAAYAAGGGTVYLPNATYIVNPATPITPKTNVTITGDSATLKVKNTAGTYEAVIKSTASMTGVTLRGLIIDQNSANNVLAALAHPQYAIYCTYADDCIVEKCRFEATGVNTIAISGNCHRISVLNNVIHYVPNGGTTTVDNSAIYIDAVNHVIQGNYIYADSKTVGAVSAIETHCGPSVVSGNISRWYKAGINVVSENIGGAATGDMSITGNTITGAVNGISMYVPSGQILKNVSITGNTINLAQATWLEMIASLGIGAPAGDAVGTLTGVSIVGNTITGELEAAEGRTLTTGYLFQGIGLAAYGPISNVLIANNTLVDLPCIGIGLGVGSSGTNVVSNVRVAGNLISNNGQNLLATRAGIGLWNHLTNVIVENNSLIYGVIPGDWFTARYIFANTFVGLKWYHNTLVYTSGTLNFDAAVTGLLDDEKAYPSALVNIPTAANNAAAASAGVAVGGWYRTNADPSVLCVRSA